MKAVGVCTRCLGEGDLWEMGEPNGDRQGWYTCEHCGGSGEEGGAMPESPPTDLDRWLRTVAWCLGRGWSLLPLHRSPMPLPPDCRENKGPCYLGRPHGLERHWKSRAGLEEVMHWIETGHNIGVMCGAISGIVGVDLDNEAAVEWARAHLPYTPYRVKTGRGEHCYYQYPYAPPRNRYLENPRLEVRAHHQYLVFPWSVHPSGQIYTFTGDWWGEMPYFPSEVFEQFDRPAEGHSSRAMLSGRASAPSACTWSFGSSSRCECDSCRVRRAGAWLAHYPPAAIGKGSYAAAAKLVADFGLDNATAIDLLLEYYPEEKARLKVINARRYARGLR